MKIPRDPIRAQGLYDELIRQCLSSRSQRYSLYSALRNYYLFASVDKQGAPYNKIESTVDTLRSFIYSSVGTKFSIHLGTTASDEDVHKAPLLAAEVTDQWRTSGTHLLFGQAVNWGLVFGCMIAKEIWNGKHSRTYLVEPHQFGVLREDKPQLADQEAFTMCYTITLTQLESDLKDNPRQSSIMERVGKSSVAGYNTLGSEGMQRLVLGGPIGPISGSLAIGSGGGYVAGGLGGSGRGPAYDYNPRVEAEMIDMVELYVWDDELDEYRLVTTASPNVVIYDRPASRCGYVKGVPPFSVIRPDDKLYDYFWGASFVAGLSDLMDWRTERIRDIRAAIGKQFDPPMSATGAGGMNDERMAALRKRGGNIALPNPNVKFQAHPPPLPQDAFAEIREIDGMFDDQAGIGHILQGKGEQGVRSRGQADLMARLGSARPKERAVAIEEAAGEIASLKLRNVQDHSKQRFLFQPDGKGEKIPFIAENFTKDYEVRVDGHSSSPIFVEDLKHDAITLYEAGVIDGEELLEMFDPPNLQHLKARAKILAQQREAAQAQQQAGGGGEPPHHGKVRKIR